MSEQAMTELAAYEVMRNAMDHRYGLWAAVYSMAPRSVQTKKQLRAEAQRAIQQLVSDGDLYLFKMPARWGDERPLSETEVQQALEDENNWRPRRANPRKLVRLGTTQQGTEKFITGAFGKPPPMLNDEEFSKKLFDLANGGLLPELPPVIDPLDRFGERRY